jgi:hypothetical protein
MLMTEVIHKTKPPMVLYHGTTKQFDVFDPNRAADGFTKEGCGFYFTTDRQDARGYAFPKGRLLTCELQINRLVPLKGRIKQQEVETIIKAAPDLDDTLTNWDENPRIAFRNAVRSMIECSDSPKEVFEQIWYDFYRKNPADFLTQMVRLGYDGCVIPRVDGVSHVVMYNVAKIKIVGIESVVSES